jgi:DNA adenine methylase
MRAIDLFDIFNSKLVIPYTKLKTIKEKETFYYEVRRNFNKNINFSNVHQSARLLFLNKTSFNGIFRTNSCGAYNVPFGFRVKPAFTSLKLLLNVSELIQDVVFKCQDFKEFQTGIEKGDFFYFDPPYVKTKKTSFVEYTKYRFSGEDFIILTEICNLIDNSQAFFCLSNSITSETMALTKKYLVKYHHTNQSINHINNFKLKDLIIYNKNDANL